MYDTECRSKISTSQMTWSSRQPYFEETRTTEGCELSDTILRTSPTEPKWNSWEKKHDD